MHACLRPRPHPLPLGEGTASDRFSSFVNHAASRRLQATGAGLLLIALGLFISNATARDSFTQLKDDEQIVFYPTIGQRVPGKDAWRLEIRGCIFEPEKRSLTLAVL